MINAAFFTMLTRLNASSRAVCYDYEKYFLRDGIKPVFFPPSNLFLYRLLYECNTGSRSADRLLHFLYWYSIVLPRRIFQLAAFLFGKYDVLFIERSLFRYKARPILGGAACFLARLKGVKSIYELDDYLFLASGNEELYLKRIRQADFFFTGNDIILEKARPHAKKTFYYESQIDLNKYNRVKAHGTHDPVIIGWTGTYLGELLPLKDVMSGLARKYNVQFNIISTTSFSHPDPAVKINNIRWSEATEIENQLTMDIGIMPLEDTVYNRSKQGYKLKIYMACGIPVVASNVGYNKKLIREGVNGFFADSPSEWRGKLEILVADAALRKKMGGNARAFMEENYSMEKNSRKFTEFIIEAAGHHI